MEMFVVNYSSIPEWIYSKSVKHACVNVRIYFGSLDIEALAMVQVYTFFTVNVYFEAKCTFSNR